MAFLRTVHGARLWSDDGLQFLPQSLILAGKSRRRVVQLLGPHVMRLKIFPAEHVITSQSKACPVGRILSVKYVSCKQHENTNHSSNRVQADPNTLFYGRAGI